jgi:predicted TIM-barrel fold metal-dependent hydrolase
MTKLVSRVERVIAIEEHFSTPLYREMVSMGEFFSFYNSSRSEQMGHDIGEELGDVDAKRIAQMDKAGVDVQVLSFNTPGPQGFAAKEAIPMAQDANDRLYATVQRHPSRFAGLAALPTAEPKVTGARTRTTVVSDRCNNLRTLP